MAEESSSVDHSIEMNDSIDDVIFGDDADSVILVDAPVKDDENFVVKDNLKEQQNRQDQRNEKIEERRKRKEETDSDFQKETDKFSKELKDQKRKESLSKIWGKIFFIFRPSSWIKLIQTFEPLLLTLFTDATLVLILFSLLYIMYIIFNVGDYSKFEAIFKVSSSVILIILCVVIQLNSDSESPNKEG